MDNRREVKEPIVQAATQEDLDREVARQSARRTRRSFLFFGAAAAGGYGFYRWIDKEPLVGRQELPLRKTFEANAALSRKVFREANLAPTYPLEKAVPELRFNGNFGLRDDLKLESWRLQLVGVENAHHFPQYTDDVTAWKYEYGEDTPSGNEPKHIEVKGPPKPEAARIHKRGSEEAGESASGLRPRTPGLLLTMADVRGLPRREFATEFKCIEGWSEVARWAGVRLADLIAAFPPARNARGEYPRYVYMETPDGDYYCGYDLLACQHPQSLLAYEISGRPITRWHGAPLRLHMPIKYGYKQIKRIGLIAYTDERPDDYWTKLGYDWYAGL